MKKTALCKDKMKRTIIKKTFIERDLKMNVSWARGAKALDAMFSHCIKIQMVCQHQIL